MRLRTLTLSIVLGAFLVGNVVSYAQVLDGATYYVDADAGADTNLGTAAAPWKTAARVGAAQHLLRPGDRVLFRRGQVFSGPLALESSGAPGLPITYGSYGEGAKPELTGFTTPTDWKAAGSQVWEAKVSAGASRVNLVIVNGVAQRMGRFPNADAPNGGYRSVGSHAGKTSITDPELAADPDWTGAEVVLRKYRWVIDRHRITGHSGPTLTFTPTTVYEPIDGHGYFIQDHPRTLDIFGEWFFDPKARTLRLHLGDSEPSRNAVRVSAVDTLVAAGRRSDLVFEGLRLTGANRVAIDLEGASQITIRNCDVRWSGVNAIEGRRVEGALIEDCSIEDTNNNAIALGDGASRSTVRRVTIRNTGMIPGMGASGDGASNAITVLGGSDNLIEAFTITDTGYIPVHFGGSRVTVRNGFIDGFASVKDDAGGIYTWTGATDRTAYVDRRIVGNVVLHGRGAKHGAKGEAKGFGIYLDDAASEVEVRGNTVAHSSAGIFLHNAHHCRILGNTFFDNDVQMLIMGDDIAPEARASIRGLLCADNILVSRTEGQRVLSTHSLRDDVAQFGTFERNIYARPADQALIVEHAVRNRWRQAYDLEGRRAVSGQEAGTRTSAVLLPPRAVTTRGPNLVPNGDFATAPKDVSCWSAAGNGELSWAKEKLDGGCLHHRYKAPAADPKTSLLLVRAGAVSAGKAYLLKFSIQGSVEHGSAGVRLREWDRPWDGLTDYQDVKVDATRRECEILFRVESSRTASQIEWAFNERDGTLWLDNVSLHEAEAGEPDPRIFRLEVNPTEQSRTLRLDQPWVDVAGRTYLGEVPLPSRASLVLIRKDACVGLK
jgi:parallel beta-helix repeat protein